MDNTIIDYEALIREEVAGSGLLPSVPAGDKRALRDALRAIEDGEEHWTRLQGRIYGPGLEKAAPFPGVTRFVRRAAESGCELLIVSHKTPVAARDDSGYDLHAAARRWLVRNNLVGEGAVSESEVFFEVTRAAKVARIATLGVDVFIDDLVEVFDEADFPRGVERWLFSPALGEALPNVDRVFGSWKEIEQHVFGPA